MTEPKLDDDLTKREEQVLHYLYMDLTLKEIAKLMFIEAATVKNYNNTIYIKLGVQGNGRIGLMANRIAHLEGQLGIGLPSTEVPLTD